MEKKYRTSSCRAKNAADPTTGCRCGVGCDQPVPTYREIVAMQTDPLAFKRWYRDTFGKEKSRYQKEVRRAQRENEREMRLMIYLDLVSRINDEESLKVLREVL